MPLSLLPPVAAYFEANTTFNVDGMLAAFADDAVVLDEKRTHQGSEAIRAWIEDATVGNQAIATPQEIRTEDGGQHVTARVEGAFRGSPIALIFHFRVQDGCIIELKID